MHVKRKFEESNTVVHEKAPRVENEVPALPTEIWLSIFSFFSPNTLACCALVCHQWHILASDNLIWNRLFLKNFGELSFESADVFIKEQEVSLKQVYSFFPNINRFKNTIMEKIMYLAEQEQIIQTAGPIGVLHHFNAAPAPFVLSGKFKFFVDKSLNTIFAKNLQNRDAPIVTFEGDINDVFTAIAVEKDLLFAYTQTGHLACWNIHTREMQRRNQQESGRTRSAHFFIVQDGWIVTLNHGQKLEVISIENLDQVHVCQDSLQEVLFSDSPENIASIKKFIVDNKLYLVTSYSLIFIWDLKERKRVDYIETRMPVQTLMCAKNDKIYFADNRHTISLVDIKDRSLKELMSLDAGDSNAPLAMSCFGDHFLIIVFIDRSKQWGVNLSGILNFSVINMHTCETITKNKPIEIGLIKNPFNDLIHSCLSSMFSNFLIDLN